MSKLHFVFILSLFFNFSCTNKQEKDTLSTSDSINSRGALKSDTVIIDCAYTFEQAIEGSNAPLNIINQLTLFDVIYYSTDNKLHKGQILTNKRIAEDIRYMFDFMLKEKFPVAKAIPVVKYNWNDNLSMQDNNSYSFCYRNVSYSAHAIGWAIDINPFFNPMRWEEGYKYGNRKDVPEGAVYNPKRKGTFTPESSVVKEFIKRNFHWGRTMKQKNDDHHFQKAGFKMPKRVIKDTLINKADTLLSLSN